MFLFIAIGRIEMACNSSGLGFANRGLQLFDVVPHEPLRMAVVWITGIRRAQHGCQEQTRHYTITILSNDCSQDAGCVHRLNVACCSCFLGKNYVGGSYLHLHLDTESHLRPQKVFLSD